MPVAATILRRVRGQGLGTVFTWRDFDDLGSRATVDQALSRLASSGRVRRVDRGVYDLPRNHPTVGRLWPSADAVAQAVAKRTDSSLQVSGAAAVNALGLSTQVPAQVEYLTDGRSRTVNIGNLVVHLKHGNRVDMLLPNTRAGMAIVALRYLGRHAASKDVLQRLSASLDDADKQQLCQVRARLSGWLGPAVDDVVGGS